MKHDITYRNIFGTYKTITTTRLDEAIELYKRYSIESTDTMLISYIPTDNGKINTFQLMHVKDGSTCYIASVSSKWNGNTCSHMDTRL
jgi:hypothetical protein